MMRTYLFVGYPNTLNKESQFNRGDGIKMDTSDEHNARTWIRWSTYG